MPNNKPKPPKLALIVPYYNEENLIKKTFAVLHDKLMSLISQGIIHEKSILCFVDDGSSDNTNALLKESLPPPLQI